MAELSPETITAIFELQQLLLQIIDRASNLEFAILEQFGETETTIIELDEIQNVKERASSFTLVSIDCYYRFINLNPLPILLR